MLKRVGLIVALGLLLGIVVGQVAFAWDPGDTAYLDAGWLSINVNIDANETLLVGLGTLGVTIDGKLDTILGYDIPGRFSTIDADLVVIDASLFAIEGKLDALDTLVTAVDTTTLAIQTTVGLIATDVTTIVGYNIPLRFNTLDAAVAGLSTGVGTLTTNLALLETKIDVWTPYATGRFDTIDSGIAALSTTLGIVNGNVATIITNLATAEGKLEALALALNTHDSDIKANLVAMELALSTLANFHFVTLTSQINLHDSDMKIALGIHDAHLTNHDLTVMIRFNAVDAALALIEGKCDVMEGKLDVLEVKNDAQEVKLDVIEGKLDVVEVKLDALEVKNDAQEVKLDSLETKADLAEAKLDTILDKQLMLENRLAKIEEDLYLIKKALGIPVEPECCN